MMPATEPLRGQYCYPGTLTRSAHCAGCARPFLARKAASRTWWCGECIKIVKRQQTLAIRAVGVAVRIGMLPLLDGSIPCTDCAKPALEYDHRDYSQPLQVEPCCKSCNRKRGPAKFTAESIDGIARLEALGRRLQR